MKQTWRVPACVIAVATGVLLALFSFSPAALAGSLITLYAMPHVDGSGGLAVRLAWRTGDELQTAGYHLHRADRADSSYQRITSHLIPVFPDMFAGGQYAFDDTRVQPGRDYYYQMEEVTLNGQTRRHGPVSLSVVPSSKISNAAPPATPTGMGAFALLLTALLVNSRLARDRRRKLFARFWRYPTCFDTSRDFALEAPSGRARAHWVLLRLGFVVGFVVFALTVFDVLPGVFLFVGFILYCISVTFWLYPNERLFPNDGC